MAHEDHPTRTGLIDRLRRGLTGRDPREPGVLNHVSLGSHCHMAQILKETGLRRWSGAFDWIFSTPGMVRDCLADDFAGLLDRTQYESTPRDERPVPDAFRCRHRLYAERYGLPFVFNHHDPATSEADYRFLCEGVRRLRAALDAPERRNRFYLMATTPTPDALIAELAALLGARPARSSLVFLQVVPGAGEARAVRTGSDAADLVRITLETRSASTGLRFGDRQDDAVVADVVRAAASTAPLAS